MEDLTIPGDWVSVVVIIIVTLIWIAGYFGFRLGLDETDREDQRRELTKD